MSTVELALNKTQLIDAINKGYELKFLFFWGHQPKNDTSLGKECFSQWYPSPFELNDIQYISAEHYMMAEKAKLFHNDELVSKILNATHPGEAKRLGREIINFDEALWIKHRFDIVVSGNLAKFRQHANLRQFLLNTGARVLVEASPVDKIWGIGLASDAPDVRQPQKWPGENLLGFALMQVRTILANES